MPGERRLAALGRLTRAAGGLGGSFHKTGQILATRSDLFSERERAVLGRPIRTPGSARSSRAACPPGSAG